MLFFCRIFFTILLDHETNSWFLLFFFHVFFPLFLLENDRIVIYVERRGKKKTNENDDFASKSVGWSSFYLLLLERHMSKQHFFSLLHSVRLSN